jgi:competence ComEA-like helix-hairpin-helix protein
MSRRLLQQEWVKDYFTFTKKERRAVLVLVVLVCCFALLPKLFPVFIKEEPLTTDPQLEQQLAAIKLEADTKQTSSYNNRYEPDAGSPQPAAFSYNERLPKGDLFYFDPNTATAQDWLRLGIREKTVQTILNYRSKGGRFKTPDDLGKIYGLRNGEYERLKPFVQIQQTGTDKPAFTNTTVSYTNEKRYPAKEAVVIQINDTDSSGWQGLKGIGPGYARRIVQFREKLGGFISVEQVKETFGLPDSVYQKIKPFLQLNNPVVRKININTATQEELKAHPYIDWRMAKLIVEYRNQHGRYTELKHLLRIALMDDLLFSKISPYLTVE